MPLTLSFVQRSRPCYTCYTCYTPVPSLSASPRSHWRQDVHPVLQSSWRPCPAYPSDLLATYHPRVPVVLLPEPLVRRGNRQTLLLRCLWFSPLFSLKCVRALKAVSPALKPTSSKYSPLTTEFFIFTWALCSCFPWWHGSLSFIVTYVRSIEPWPTGSNTWPLLWPLLLCACHSFCLSVCPAVADWLSDLSFVPQLISVTVTLLWPGGPSLDLSLKPYHRD